MTSIMLVIASLGLNHLIGISAHPGTTLDACRSVGAEAIAALTPKITVGSGPASYECFDVTGRTGVLTVIAFVSEVDGTILIRSFAKPTLEACVEAGKSVLAQKTVSGAMTWTCFNIPGTP
jgi:hypothetical protein